jgi:hypothetical protein
VYIQIERGSWFSERKYILICLWELATTTKIPLFFFLVSCDGLKLSHLVQADWMCRELLHFINN